VNERAELATAAGIVAFHGDGTRSALAALLPGVGQWELEIGFGKGRYLLARAAAEPGRRFLGIEVAGEYFRLAAGRLRRRGLANVALLHGDALALLSARLPPRFAAAAHVYFPDPWPKTRHRKRRLFSPGSLDVVLGALAPGGVLSFATDFLAYGAEVADLLAAHPGVALERLPGEWPEGPRTNYEAKYVAAGRPIVRLRARVAAEAAGLHPGARDELAVAAAGPRPPAGV
jgi:tRNA (guanine-N7-)-methyltransferase